MGVQAVSGMAAIAALTLGSIRTVTEKNAPARQLPGGQQLTDIHAMPHLVLVERADG